MMQATHKICMTWLLSCCAISAFAAYDSPVSPIDLGAARQQFQAAQEICSADGGKFWGVSLCGPILFVDPQSRRLVANQPDAEGILKPQDGVFVGSLPTSINVSNTPTQWSGVLWSQIFWPLPEDMGRRNTLLAHELFHRIQTKVPVPTQVEVTNDHLDTLEGRVLIQLEWRALAAALRCSTPNSCRQAVSDALLFRAARYQLFATAAAQEKSLELNEGIAEYTGIRIGNETHQEQLEVALWDLSVRVNDETFVRSFAYATGPAYGLLLDKYSPDWRRELRASPSLNDLLQKAAHVALPENLISAAALRAPHYDGTTLRAAELGRETIRQQTLAANRAKFIVGPVLIIPLHHSNIQFNPRNLQPMEKEGTVYPTMRISADWGVLEVENGALLKPDWSAVSVIAPSSTVGAIKGDGWTLALNPQWKLIPAERQGDLTLSPSAQ
jgi:hypothetical protein